MRPGVPATLGWMISPSDNGRTDPEIEPFPSWEMNEVGNCSALQFVQGIAVDTDGIMWVIDSGRVDTLSQGKSRDVAIWLSCAMSNGSSKQKVRQDI